MLSVSMLSVIMLSVIMLSVITVSVIMLSVIYVECCKYDHYAECHGAILRVGLLACLLV
jgi:hypothetical protein